MSRLWLAGSLAVCALALAFALAPAAGGDRPKTTASDEEIAKLILQLGADKFATREQAQQSLLRIGKPALEALRKATLNAPGEEVRGRALKLVEQIDPGAGRRAALEKHRAAQLKDILEKKGVDVTNWAESIANPFSDLTDEGKQRLSAEGIDVARLQKMRARYLRGSYGGALAKEFINPDPDTILVVGKGFCTHGGVYSAGPVLAVEDANLMSHVNVANLLWFVDRAGASNSATGTPVLKGDTGWRKPMNFLQHPSAADARNDSPPTEALANARRELAAQVKKAGAVDVKEVATAVANPFTALTEEGKAKLRFRGISVERLPRLKAVYLTGNYCGAAGKDFVNNDPDTVLVIGKGFVTHGQVYSLGPILAVEDAHFMNNVTGADVVWFVDQSFPRGKTLGAPVILAPTASHSQMDVATRHVWFGDYGWQRPKDFQGPAKPGDGR